MGIGPDKRNQRERLERLGKVAERYLCCVPVHQIADEFGVPVNTIFRDLRKLRTMWEKHAQAGARAIIAQELAKLDRIEREAWEMHERQKAEERITKLEKSSTPKGPIVRRSRVNKSPKAMASWMEIVLKCMEERAKLLKLHDPEISTAGVMRAMIVEVTVEDAAQVAQMQNFEEFRRLAASPVLEAEATLVSDPADTPTERDGE